MAKKISELETISPNYNLCQVGYPSTAYFPVFVDTVESGAGPASQKTQKIEVKELVKYIIDTVPTTTGVNNIIKEDGLYYFSIDGISRTEKGTKIYLYGETSGIHAAHLNCTTLGAKSGRIQDAYIKTTDSTNLNTTKLIVDFVDEPKTTYNTSTQHWSGYGTTGDGKLDVTKFPEGCIFKFNKFTPNSHTETSLGIITYRISIGGGSTYHVYDLITGGTPL